MHTVRALAHDVQSEPFDLDRVHDIADDKPDISALAAKPTISVPANTPVAVPNLVSDEVSFVTLR